MPAVARAARGPRDQPRDRRSERAALSGGRQGRLRRRAKAGGSPGTGDGERYDSHGAACARRGRAARLALAHAAHARAADRRHARRRRRLRRAGAPTSTPTCCGSPRSARSRSTGRRSPGTCCWRRPSRLGTTCCMLANLALVERRLGRRPIQRAGSRRAVAGRRLAVALAAVAGRAAPPAQPAGPGSCCCCGPTAATSARATRCSTATSASSSSRSRCTAGRRAGCCETLRDGRGRVTVARLRASQRQRCARARARTCSRSPRCAAGRARLALPARAVRARRCRTPGAPSRAPPTPTSTCGCRSCARSSCSRSPAPALCAATPRCGRCGSPARRRRSRASPRWRSPRSPTLPGLIERFDVAPQALAARAPVRRRTRSPRPGARSRSTASTCASVRGDATLTARRRSPTQRAHRSRTCRSGTRACCARR